jgi:hypothetical protein
MIEIDFIAINGIVGFFLPLVISFLKQSTWTAQVKKAFALVVAVVAAVVAAGIQEGWTSLSWEVLVASAAIILPMVKTSYDGIWEDSAIEVKVASVIDRTSI